MEQFITLQEVGQVRELTSLHPTGIQLIPTKPISTKSAAQPGGPLRNYSVWNALLPTWAGQI